MKTILLLICINLVVGCAATRFQPDSWVGTPNPLNPVDGEPSAATLHRDNMRAITSNPSYQLP